MMIACLFIFHVELLSVNQLTCPGVRTVMVPGVRTSPKFMGSPDRLTGNR